MGANLVLTNTQHLKPLTITTMRPTILIALFLFSLLSGAYAQQGGKIEGRIASVGETESPLTGATVSLLNAKDSASLKNTLTAKDGSFAFTELADGAYLISITAVGHQKRVSPPLRISPEKQVLSLPLIKLAPASKSLSGVTVT